MEEIWKEIPNYEGYYAISNIGRVKALEREIINSKGVKNIRKERIKKQFETRDGYYSVKLSKNGKDRRYFTHVLVAKTFIENKDYSHGWEINHKDCNRKNNNVDNLEWVRHVDNVSYSVNKGHYKGAVGKKNGRCIPTIMKDLVTGDVKRFDCIGECIAYMFKTNPKLKSLTSENNLRTEIHKRQNNGKLYRKKYKFDYA